MLLREERLVKASGAADSVYLPEEKRSTPRLAWRGSSGPRATTWTS